MRKMASIRTIKELRPILGADKIELAIIDGWQVVVKKGEHQPGEQVVYLEIDSWVPTEVAPFLTKGAKEPREFEGVKGERLKTIKLRGEVSQGLVLPLNVIPREAFDSINALCRIETLSGDEIYSGWDGWDVTDVLGVKKWEKAVAANMRGNARRYFPAFIQKTDQERIQNMLRTLEARHAKDPHEVYEVTLKLDGSSTTFYVHPNEETGEVETGVCSRNLELKTDESNAENIFVQKYHALQIDQRLKEFYAAKGRSIAIQGELWGAGINGNWEGIDKINFSVFDVFDCDKYKYVDAPTRYDVLQALGGFLEEPQPHAPLIDRGTLRALGLDSLKIEDFLKYADRPSLHNKTAEGVVFKSLKDPNFSFKVINNNYLLIGGE
jgi:RNA ligase (TIGR02306 family)